MKSFEQELQVIIGLSLKGGSEKARYFVSGGYQDTQGIVINSFNKRYTARINTDFDISKNVTVGTNLFIVKEDELNVSNQGADGPNGSILQAVSYAPTIPVWDDAEGDYSQPNAIYGVISDNPVYRLKERNNRGRRNKLNLSAYLKWDLTENLSFRTSAVSNSQVYNVSVFNRFAPGGGIQDSQANHGNSYLNSFQNSNVLNYKNTFGDHSINASLIFETFQTETRRNNINATALKSIALGEYSTSFGEAISGASSLTASQLESYVGRVNYNFKEKYLLTATLRVDGSSKFAKGNRYGTFPSAAFGWKISEESFIKDIDVIDNLKFRASWGATGNQGINPYETLSTLGVGSNLPYQGGATSVSVGVAPNRIANSDLKWETTYQTNLGIDFGLFNSRLYGSVDWYKKTTEDLLLDVQLASSNGIPSQLKNIGEIENKGIELELGGIAIDNNDFRWTVSGNIAFNRNKVVSLIDSDNDSEILFTNNYFGNRVQGGAPNVLAEGHPIGMLWGLTYLGPWQIGQEAEAAEYGRVPGDAHFADPDGNKKYDDFGIIGDPNPDFTWGMSHKFTYKNLDLNMLLTGVQGKDVWNFVRWQTVSEFGGIRNPTNKDFINRWSPTNQGATLPGISATNEFRPQNTEFVEDGSYIKLKDVTLGYTHKADNYEGRIYISGQNLLMITDYRGLDPEADGQGSSNSGAQGGDTGAYPNSKSFTIGLNIKF
jgi:TonB-linked SusC/RagA family outer membrane protein